MAKKNTQAIKPEHPEEPKSKSLVSLHKKQIKTAEGLFAGGIKKVYVVEGKFVFRQKGDAVMSIDKTTIPPPATASEYVTELQPTKDWQETKIKALPA